MPAAMIVSWNVTRRCNLLCRHCYLDAVGRARASAAELDTRRALHAIEQIAGVAPAGMLVLSGGEPLLRRDLAELVAHASAHGLLPVIGTNGLLVNERRSRELNSAGAAGIGISVDSARPDFHDELRGLAGAWRGAWRAIRIARHAGLTVSLHTTLFERNRRDLEALADLAEAHGAAALNLFFLVCTGRGQGQTDLSAAAREETLDRIVELQRARPRLLIRARCAPYLRRRLGEAATDAAGVYASWSSACLAGRGYFRITPEGEVTPCPFIPEPLGDLRHTPLREIWEGHPVLARLRSEPPAGKCGACDFRHACGGCRARAFAATGDVMGEDPQCGYVKSADAPAEMPAPTEAIGPRTFDWEPEALARLDRIPAFVRAAVVARLEGHAALEGVSRITAEFMNAHRPPMLSGVAPAAGQCPWLKSS